MVFSATCPTISLEQVEAEINCLSAEEYERLQDDLYDRRQRTQQPQAQSDGAATRQEPAMPSQLALRKENALEMLNEAIDALPMMEKRAYMQTLERNPSLVQTESDPFSFLRHAEFDCWLAASRLVKYWKLRVEFFGTEKAMDAMTQDGAMREDIVFLEAPSVTVAPPVKGGRFVFHMDRDRLVRIPGGNRKAFVRTCFSINHSINQQDKAISFSHHSYIESLSSLNLLFPHNSSASFSISIKKWPLQSTAAEVTFTFTT